MTSAKFETMNHIEVDPALNGGAPAIRGTTVTVEEVLSALSEAIDPADVLRTFPQLTFQDLQAALAFARQAIRFQGEAADTRRRLIAFAGDWDDPAMDVYDASLAR